MRHVFDENRISYSMYDKFNCLRIKMTINDPKEFKVYKEVLHEDGTASMVSNLYRYAEISRSANMRYLLRHWRLCRWYLLPFFHFLPS